MALNFLLPLLNVGISLASNLFKNDDNTKNATLSSLERMFKAGDSANLEAEVQRLTLLADMNKSQSSTTLASIERGGGKWRDMLGTVGVVGIAYNFIGIPLTNTGINFVNSFLEPPVIQNIATMDMTDMLTLMFGMLGIGGLDLIKKRI